MSIATDPHTGVPLLATFDALLEIEREIADAAQLHLYPFQPVDGEAPMLYNRLGNNAPPNEKRTTATMNEWLELVPTVVVDHTDNPDEQYRLLTYAEPVRARLDQEWFKPDPLGGTVTEAFRTRAQTIVVEIGGISYLGMEFPIVARLHRTIQPA